MKTLHLLVFASFSSIAACSSAPSPKPPAEIATTSTTSSTAVAPEPASTESSATPTKDDAAPTSTEPEFAATPSDQLKTITKADVLAADKSIKKGASWADAFARVTKKLGPPTYVTRSTLSDSAWAKSYQWSAMRKAGGCDAFWMQSSTDEQSVVDLGVDSVEKDSTTLPSVKGGKPIDSCTGVAR